jgi:hypothetical protein
VQQRTIFLYSVVAFVIILFILRMVVVNIPEQVSEGQPRTQLRQLPEGNEQAIEIYANESKWMPVGRGPLTIAAAGTADLGNGLKTAPDDQKKPGDNKALVPDLPYGMLVGKVGENGAPFRIGKHAQIAMKETVFLAINDDDYSDNSGSYVITVTGGTKY